MPASGGLSADPTRKMSVRGQYFLRRAQRQRESAWQALDAESPGMPGHLPPLQDIRRRAIDDYVQNGGDLSRMHRQAALDMSRRLLAMELLLGHNTPLCRAQGPLSGPRA